MRIKTIYVPLIVVSILVLGISISNTMGYWQTTSSKVPDVIREGAFAGRYNPADIRGSYTFADIEAAFNVSAEVLAEAFGVESTNPAVFQVKELENLYSALDEGLEIGTASIRYFVALYTHLPYDDSLEIPYLTEKAVEILTEKQCISSDNEILIIPDSALANEVSPNNNEHDEEIFEITGQTSIKEVKARGILIDDLENLLGIKITNENASLKSLCEMQDLNFGDIKKEVIAWIDK